MKKSQANIYHQTIAAAFLISGTFNLVAPEMAAGNKPNDPAITNTATITYGDFKGTRSKATSNSVTNTFVGVGDTSNTPNWTVNVNAGNIQPDDVLNYDYVTTNFDNDPTRMFIPSTATISAPSRLFSIIQYSTDGGTTYTNATFDRTITGSAAVRW